MHFGHAIIAAHPSTALRFRERTRSNGGIAGDDALCKAWRDCRHTVKHVQEPPLIVEDDDLWRVGIGLMLGVAVGLGK